MTYFLMSSYLAAAISTLSKTIKVPIYPMSRTKGKVSIALKHTTAMMTMNKTTTRKVKPQLRTFKSVVLGSTQGMVTFGDIFHIWLSKPPLHCVSAGRRGDSNLFFSLL